MSEWTDLAAKLGVFRHRLEAGGHPLSTTPEELAIDQRQADRLARIDRLDKELLALTAAYQAEEERRHPERLEPSDRERDRRHGEN